MPANRDDTTEVKTDNDDDDDDGGGELDLVSISSIFLSSSLTTRPNKLEGLPLNTLSSQVFVFEGSQSQPNWSTFQMLPSWVSSLC
jgi:hypothetical protein